MKVSSTLFASILAMASALASPRMDDARFIPANMTHTDMTVHEDGLVGLPTTPLRSRGLLNPGKKKKQPWREIPPFGFEIYWYTPDGLVYYKSDKCATCCWVWGDPSDEDDPLTCQGNPCYWARLRWANDRAEQFFQEGYLAYWQTGPFSEGQKQAIAELDKADFKEDVTDRICQPA